MKQIEDIAIKAVKTKIQILIKNEVHVMINRVVEEAIKSVTNSLHFKIIPVDNTNFKIEAFWDTMPKGGE